MVVLDSVVVITALPRMQRDLHVSLASLQWTLNAYGIAFAAGIITAAALGDRFGRRRVFTVGLALFTLASAACALAPNAVRADRRAHRAGPRRRDRAAAQPDDPDDGVPARAARDDRRRSTAASPGSPSRWGRSSAARSRRASTGTGSSGSTCRSASSPPLLGLRLLPESYGAPERLDLLGVGLVTAGVVALVWALIRANDVGWASAEIVGTLLAGGVLLARVRRVGSSRAASRWCRCGCSRSGTSRSATSRPSSCPARSSPAALLVTAGVPVRPRLLAASATGAAPAAVLRHADAHLADRRRSVGPHRPPADHGRRAEHADGRVRLGRRGAAR